MTSVADDVVIVLQLTQHTAQLLICMLSRTILLCMNAKVRGSASLTAMWSGQCLTLCNFQHVLLSLAIMPAIFHHMTMIHVHQPVAM